MKCLLLISTLTVFLFGQQAFAQEVPIAKSDLFGNWTSIRKTEKGFEFESPCDKSEIILLKKFIVFAYQNEKHDTLLIENSQQITKGSILVSTTSSRLEITRVKCSWFDKKRDILIFEFADKMDSTLTGYKQLICRDARKKGFLVETEPCPDYEELNCQFEIIIKD